MENEENELMQIINEHINIIEKETLEKLKEQDKEKQNELKALDEYVKNINSIISIDQSKEDYKKDEKDAMLKQYNSNKKSVFVCHVKKVAKILLKYNTQLSTEQFTLISTESVNRVKKIVLEQEISNSKQHTFNQQLKAQSSKYIKENIIYSF